MRQRDITLKVIGNDIIGQIALTSFSRYIVTLAIACTVSDILYRYHIIIV